MPEGLKGHVYYKPTEHGYEKDVKGRLEGWREKTRIAKRDKKEEQ
jgi:replication-associated recombination protein RarA